MIKRKKKITKKTFKKRFGNAKCQQKTKALLVAGGTGGHIVPGISLALTLEKQGVLTSFLSLSKNRNYTDFFHSQGIVFHLYKAPPIPSPLRSLKIILFPYQFCKAMIQTLWLIQRENFHFIIGMGGYPMLPALMAAVLLRVPYYLCEQNAIPGRASRLFYKGAKKVFINFPLVHSKWQKAKNTISHVGNPLRPKLIEKIKHTPKKKKQELRILVLGGSQGALQINKIMTKIIPALGSKNYQWFIQCGQKHLQSMSEKLPSQSYPNVKLFGYLSSIEELYLWADVLICRAGAGVLSESICFGLPLLLIPYPYASDSHQEANANYLNQAGAAQVFHQKDTNPDKLLSYIKKLHHDVQKQKQMRHMAVKLSKPNAAKAICSQIMD